MIISMTQRLLLREATIEDSEFILKLVNQPAWHEFIGSHSIDSIENTNEYIQQKMLAMYQQYGFGLWVVEKLEGKIQTGICGLLKRDSLDVVDLGFAFLENYWGQGFAFEAARATLNYASNELKRQKVVAILNPLNIRSVKLLNKLGFHYESTYSHPGSDEVLSLYTKNMNNSNN